VDEMVIGDMNAAYATILDDGDPVQLIRLIEETGPVIESLEHGTATELFMRFIGFLKSHTYLGEHISPGRLVLSESFIRICVSLDR
jgi:hypothetical protein